MPVHLRDEFVGPADAGGEVAAGVTGEDLVEEAPFGGADVVAAAVALLGERGEQPGRPDADALQGGGEELDVVVGLQLQVGTDAKVPACLVADLGKASGCVAVVARGVWDPGPPCRHGRGGL
ncbi:hypothetical protein [Streptomyces sp. NPDC088707]|uniref:hypothetical protein n=1 Tax=Streptomyces sp. NPDC088707 TaxID=3365871 RepID=UPI0038025045